MGWGSGRAAPLKRLPGKPGHVLWALLCRPFSLRLARDLHLARQV